MGRSRNKSRRVEPESKVLWMLKPLLGSYMVTALLLFALAGLLYKFELGEKTVTIGIIVIYILATLVGGISLGRKAQMKRFLWGLSLGASYFIVLLLISVGVYRVVGFIEFLQSFVSLWDGLHLSKVYHTLLQKAIFLKEILLYEYFLSEVGN